MAPWDSANSLSEISNWVSRPNVVVLTSIAILKVFQSPKKDTDVAIALDVSPAQANTWLHRLVDAGVLEKRSKPVAYATKPTGLFS